MGRRFAGGALRLSTTFVYFLAFLCAAIGLGIYSYFLAKLSYHHIGIENKWRAVEGITGAGVLYTIFAVLLTCFLGGKAFFALLALILNVAFFVAFIAVAVLTRDGADSCSGNNINTPLGFGASNTQQAGTNQGTACRLNTAVFATAIAAALLFFIAILLQFLLMKNHRKEKKYGPSPANNYTSGSGKRKFWQKKPKVTKDVYNNSNGAELGAVGAAGTTAGTNGNYHSSTDAKYESAHGGYGNVHQGPGPTANGNPYGYNNTA